MGFSEGFISPVKRIDIDYKYFQLSLKLGSVIGDYWEIEANEKLKNKLSSKKKIVRYLLNQANKLSLTCWSEDKFREIRIEKWKNIPPVSLEKLFRYLKDES